MSWKAQQTGPQYAAEAGLALSAVSKATVADLIHVNKVIRDIKNNAKQTLKFHNFHRKWQDLATVVWADASQGNRPDKSSTMGLLAGISPKEILQGEEMPVNLVHWKSTKTPRSSLGSNGSEVQAITFGEDWVFLVRLFWCEINGVKIQRHQWHTIINEHTVGSLVMDSRGIYDAATRNESSLHGLRSSRAGYELVAAVKQAKQIGTALRWVNGGAQLADGLTKIGYPARGTFELFFKQNFKWRVIHDEKYESQRRRTKKGLKALQEEIAQREQNFLYAIERFAAAEGYDFDLTVNADDYDDEMPTGLAEARRERDGNTIVIGTKVQLVQGVKGCSDTAPKTKEAVQRD